MANSADDICIQPEILSQDALISALKSHQIKEDELQFMDKSQLVELYHAHVVPMPQRFDHNSRRWRRIHATLIAQYELKNSNGKVNDFSVKENGASSNERLMPSQSIEDLYGKNGLSRKRSISDVGSLKIDEKTSVHQTATMITNSCSFLTKKSKTMDSESPMFKSKRKPITWP